MHLTGRINAAGGHSHLAAAGRPGLPAFETLSNLGAPSNCLASYGHKESLAEITPHMGMTWNLATSLNEFFDQTSQAFCTIQQGITLHRGS